MSHDCLHFVHVANVKPGTRGCEECLKMGST
jgi:hypothetical protein